MEISQFIPNRFLPKAFRSDVRAVTKVTDEIKVTKKKRLTGILNKQRKYIANMQQDELKLALEIAKDPKRPRRDILYAMYDEVWDGDGHAIGETRKAILKAVGSPSGVFPEGGEEIDEVATRLLQRKWFEDTRKYFHQSPFWGHSLVQIVEFRKSNVAGMPEEIKRVELIDREHVRPEEGYVVLDTSHEIGIPFRDPAIARKLLLIEMGDPKHLGLLRVMTKEFIWKNYSRSDWSRHSEKYGMPMLTIKTDTSNEKELKETEEMASNFGNNLWMILDTDDEVELKEPTFKDAYKIYLEKAKFCNDEMSKAISGATGTSDEKAFVGGAKVHERILNDFIEAAKRAETYYINEELFPLLIELGYPLQGKEFRYLEYQNNDPEESNEEEPAKKGVDNNDPKKKGSGGSPAKKPRGAYRHRMT